MGDVEEKDGGPLMSRDGRVVLLSRDERAGGVPIDGIDGASCGGRLIEGI